MSDSLYTYWSEVCYIPHNDAFSIAMRSMSEGEPYNRTTMAEIHDARIAEAEANGAARANEVTEEEAQKMRQLFEWVKTATRVLLDHVAQLGAVGDLPVITGSQFGAKGKTLTEYEASDLGQLAIRISQLPGTPFMGWRTPAMRARFSEHHERGIVIDVVPADPRFGGHIPDWGKPDTAERFPKDA